MHILLSNDDGVYADGINTLALALSDIATITIVAPDRNRSAVSNSLTLDTPIRARELTPNTIMVQGTPTDCVHLALSELLEEKPDLLISGINHGSNLGDDVLYSGTVAAATEGYFLGIPSIAISLVGDTHFDTAANFILQFVKDLVQSPIPCNEVLNINVPDIPENELQGVEITRLGQRYHAENMIKVQDPRGEDVYWIGPPGETAIAGVGTDFYAIEHKKVSITPLKVDLTAEKQIATLAQWIKNKE